MPNARPGTGNLDGREQANRWLRLAAVSEEGRMRRSGSKSRARPSSRSLVTYGTEPMPESLLLRLSQAFPGAKYLQTFGTSETG
jgi:hypothetical protein